FQILGKSRKILQTGHGDWIACSNYFAHRVDARGESKVGYVLNLKLFQEKQMLLEWDTKLSESSPLVIKGPQVGGGQLLLVLVIDDEERKTQSSGDQHPSDKKSNKLVLAWRHLSEMFRKASP